MDVNALMNFKDSNGTNNVVYPITKKANVIGLEQDLTNMASSINSASTAVEGKVDKVTGKGLSTEDFTTAEKQKLAGIEAGATVVTVDSQLSNTSENPVQNKVVYSALGDKVDKISGKGLSKNDFTDALKTKLDGIATGATAVTVDSSLSSTSENPVQNKVINTALGNKVDKITGKGLSQNDFTDAYKADLDGLDTALDAKADASDLTAAQNQLNSLNDEFTALETTVAGKASASDLTSLATTVGGKADTSYVNTELAKKVDKVSGKGLSTNDFTAAYKSQLDSLDGNLEAKADATYVDAELAKKVNKITGKGLSTNDYTTAEKEKLANIEAGATATTVDNALSSVSINPVQNKIVKAAIDAKAKVYAQASQPSGFKAGDIWFQTLES